MLACEPFSPILREAHPGANPQIRETLIGDAVAMKVDLPAIIGLQKSEIVSQLLYRPCGLCLMRLDVSL